MKKERKYGAKRLHTVMMSVMLGLSVFSVRAVPAAVLGTVVSLSYARTAWAVEAGTYLVTVTPSYTNPETGKVEDSGNNEAIGQGMTQKLCGPQGLLEVEDSGSMYLTVRYYLSQFVSDVSFEEQTGSSYSSCSYERMQTMEPVDGASDLNKKYGYTDYRIPIQNLNSVFRGKAYIEPMGRNVVYFFQVSNPTAGSGDFLVSVRTEKEAQTEPQLQTESQTENTGTGAGTTGRQEEEQSIGQTEQQEESGNGEADQEGQREQQVQSKSTQAISQREQGQAEKERTADRAKGDLSGGINGSGDADAPVTGIPQKPVASDGNRTLDETKTALVSDDIDRTTAGQTEHYHLETGYDLSAVPMKEARKLTEPILEAAAGITGTVGELQALQKADETGMTENRQNNNKTIMMILLGISAVLAGRFAASFLMENRKSAARASAKSSKTDTKEEHAESGKTDIDVKGKGNSGERIYAEDETERRRSGR